MMPLIDTMMAPGTMSATIAVGPAAIGLALAALVGVAVMARATAEQLRRLAARDWERRTLGNIATRPRDTRPGTAAA